MNYKYPLGIVTLPYCFQVGQPSYSLPVTVPVGYSDTGLLQSSPHMGQTSSVSPRPSSSEADSGELPPPTFRRNYQFHQVYECDRVSLKFCVVFIIKCFCSNINGHLVFFCHFPHAKCSEHGKKFVICVSLGVIEYLRETAMNQLGVGQK